jgi:aromatic-amino-acid transaminase
MLDTLGKAAGGDIVVLHVLLPQTRPAWICRRRSGNAIGEVVNRRGLVPFLDLAYQGFATDSMPTQRPLRRFAAACPAVFASTARSRNPCRFYGERSRRVATWSGKCGRGRARAFAGEARHPHELFQPAHARLADGATVLTNAGAAHAVGQRAGQMRDRIKLMRRHLVDRIREHRADFASASW